MAIRLWKTGSRHLLGAITMQMKLYKGIRPLPNVNLSVTSRRIYCANSSINNRDGEDVEERGSELYDAILEKGFDMYPKARFIGLYNYLLDLGIKDSTIESQFRETPDLMKYPIKKWKILCELLLGCGVHSEMVFKNIALCPDLLQYNVNILRQNLEKYRETYIGRLSVFEIVQRNPHLYVCSPKIITRRLELLDAMFPPSHLKNLIKNNPNILTDEWDSIIEKLTYIHTVMGLEQPHIAASAALQKSFLHIKIRHQFLYRAGLYITPNLLRDQMSDRKNPELSFIMDTSNKYFANKVAQMTSYEYEVFNNMIKEEHDFLESDDDESGFDSDLDRESYHK